MANKTEAIHLRLTPEMRAQVEENAKAEGRSLSNYITRALEKYLSEAKRAKK